MKKKRDALTKSKMLYSGELGLFSILFAVLGILFLTGTISVADWKRWAFAIVTLAGGVWLIIDFIWTLVSKKRRAKNCLLDKAMVAPMALCVLAFDILAFAFGWVNASGEGASTAILAFRLAIGIALCYYAAVYVFQAISHRYKPLPLVIEAALEAEEEEKKQAEAQEASGEQPVTEEKKEEAPTSEDSSKN